MDAFKCVVKAIPNEFGSMTARKSVITPHNYTNIKVTQEPQRFGALGPNKPVSEWLFVTHFIVAGNETK